MQTSFNKEKHEYLIDGKRATGVTTIIGVLAKPALIGWAAKMACEHIKARVGELTDDAVAVNLTVLSEWLEEARTAHTKKKEAAGTHGTDAHALVEVYVKDCLANWNGSPHLDVQEQNAAINPFIVWSVANVDHFLYSERKMFNKELFIAGTADFAYMGKDGKRYVGDFKTSSGIYGIDYWLQVAAYKMLAEAEGDTPYDGMTVVRMGKDGSFQVQQLYEYETYKEAFLCCLTLYRAQAAIKDLIIK